MTKGEEFHCSSCNKPLVATQDGNYYCYTCKEYDEHLMKMNKKRRNKERRKSNFRKTLKKNKTWVIWGSICFGILVGAVVLAIINPSFDMGTETLEFDSIDLNSSNSAVQGIIINNDDETIKASDVMFRVSSNALKWSKRYYLSETTNNITRIDPGQKVDIHLVLPEFKDEVTYRESDGLYIEIKMYVDGVRSDERKINIEHLYW